MVTENIDILVRERGARIVKRRLAEIGDVAERSVRGLRLLQNALFVLGAAGAVAGLVRLVDTLTNFENRIRLVTDSTAELNAVQAELFAISARTRGQFESTAEIYTRTALAVRDLGISQRETLNFTESLNQAVILSGASTREANAALIQLAQGLASGRLSGDELRSVLEQLPFVADIIARSLGVTRGELRELGSQGALTAEVVLKAFREARVEIAEKFAQTIPTIGQAFQVLRTETLRLIDQFDDFTRGSEIVSRSIISIAESIDLLVAGLLAGGLAFAALKLTTFIQGSLAAASASRQLAAAVAAGNATALTSVGIEKAKAATALQSAQATVASTSAKANELRVGVAQLQQNRALLVQQQASIVIDNQRRVARDGLTGRFIAYNVAVEQNIRTNRALFLTERSLTTSKSQLTAATAAQTAATNSLSAAQARSAVAGAAANTFTQKLSVAFPILAGSIGLASKALRGLYLLLGGSPLGVFISLLTFGATALFLFGRNADETTDKVQELSLAINDEGKAIGVLTNLTKSSISVTNEMARQKLNEAVNRRENILALIEEQQAILLSSDAYTEASERIKNYRELLNSIAAPGTDADDLPVSLRESYIGLQEELIKALNIQQAILKTGSDYSDALEENQGNIDRIRQALEEAKGGSVSFGNSLSDNLGVSEELRGSVFKIDRSLISGVNAANSLTGALSSASDAAASTARNLSLAVSGITSIQDETASVIERTAKLTRDTYAEYLEDIYGLEDAAGPLEEGYVSGLIQRQLREFDRLQAANENYQSQLEKINGETETISSSVGIEKVSEPLKEVLTPLQEYNEKLKELSGLLEQGKINQEEFTKSVRQTRIEFLNSQTDIGSGYERGFLKIIEQTSDAASQAEEIITSAFEGMSSALADLVLEGKTDFASLVQSINRQIVELVISQGFQQLFGDSAGAGGTGGGLFGGLLQSLAAGAAGAAAPAPAPGPTPTLSTLGSYQTGGSFMINSNTGIAPIPNGGNDNRLVAFRGQDGEQVTITPKNEVGQSGNSTTIINFNISTPDAESFRKSESQIAARMNRIMAKGQRNL